MRGFDHAKILSSSFHGLRKDAWHNDLPFVSQKFQGGGGTSRKIGRSVRHASWNPYPISDQDLWFSLPCFRRNQNLIPYFRPEALEPGAWPERVTSCYGTYTVVGVNIKREMVLFPNDEEVANSSSKKTQFKTSAQTIPWSKLIPYFRPKQLKTYPLARHMPI